MAAIFEETQDIIPKISFKILLLILVATDVFVLACCIAGIIDGYWQFAVVTIVFAAFLLIAFFVKVRIKVEDGSITVKMFKPYTVALDKVIDVKKGDIDIMRNYSGWGIKKVKFKNYTVPGIDDAVSAKLMGRIVLTMTTTRAEELYNILYENRSKD